MKPTESNKPPTELGAIDPIHSEQSHANRALCCDCVQAVLNARLGFLCRSIIKYRDDGNLARTEPVMRGLLELLMFARYMEVWDPRWDHWLPLPELGYPVPSRVEVQMMVCELDLDDDDDDDPPVEPAS